MTKSGNASGEGDRLERVRRAYAVLRSLADTGEAVSDADFAQSAGWKQNTVKSYRGKKWRDWIEKDSPYTWRVSQSFKTVTEEAFLRHQTQRTDFYASYRSRSIHHHVLRYEFLLPLTKEHELKKALDDLFYRDTLEERIREVGPGSFSFQLPEGSGLAGKTETDAIIEFMTDHFTGYSISHVSGRFRSEALADRAQVGDMLVKGHRYLVDETTAVVQFIVPLQQSSNTYPDDQEFVDALAKDSESSLSEAARVELAQVRRTFFLLFVEAVVRTVKGEDEVWLLESGPENRLYVWEKA